MSLTELLLATLDHTKREAAEAELKGAETAQTEQFFVLLATELATADKPVYARQLSGLLLKNALWSKDPAKSQSLKERWMQMSQQTRHMVKEATLGSIARPPLDVAKSAAQVLAKIGAVEIPVDGWPELVPTLLRHSHATGACGTTRQAALVALGYIGEELMNLSEDGVAIPAGTTNELLTATCHGMEDADMNIKLEAAKAFYYVVVLAKANMGRDAERHQIMTVVLGACQAASEDVQVVGFECLVQVATEYYEHLLPYMDVVAPLTWTTIRTSPEKVAIPAMEFWSTICDEELYLKDCAASGMPSEHKCLGIIHTVLPHLTQLLMEMLTRPRAEDDDDTWNLEKASGLCLGLVAQVVGDLCVETVLQFVQANVENPDWKLREAAVLAYGSILEGPTSEKMQPIVASSYPFLARHLDDESIAVRDTIAWTLGRIAQFHPTCMPVREITPVLSSKLSDVPRVAANVCWVVQVLAEAQPEPIPVSPPTTQLSEHFTMLAQALLQVTLRPDATERNMRMAAYNALSALISRSGNDCMCHMPKLIEEMINHLTHSFKNIDNECELQGYICGVLTALTQRCRGEILLYADAIMELAVKVIAAYQQVKGGQPVLQEEALLLASALASSVGPSFEKYMMHFMPYLTVGLQNYDDQAVCSIATGMVGDLCIGMGPKMLAYTESILEILYTNCKNPTVEGKIKAQIMVCFGNMALAITGEFEKYLPPVVGVLEEAAHTRITDGQPNNEAWVEYLNSLREGVLEGYTGIIHGLRDANKLHAFKEHVNKVIGFVLLICEDQTSTEYVVKAAIAVIGDLILAFRQELTAYLGGAPFLVKLIEAASRMQDKRARDTAQWLQSLLHKYSATPIG